MARLEGSLIMCVCIYIFFAFEGIICTRILIYFVCSLVVCRVLQIYKLGIKFVDIL